MATVSGVYFRHDEYASFWLRLLVDFIDILAAGIVCAAVVFVLPAFAPPRLVLFVLAALWFGYFVLLKGSKFGTVGYRLCGVRIVGLNGERPGLIALTVRMLFMVYGPFNYLLDLFWMWDGPHRQTFRDKFADTYVVRKRAVPAGSGPVVCCFYEILCYNFLLREIRTEAI